MISSIVQILTTEGQSLTEQIKSNVPKVTGKSAQSVGYEVVVDGSIVSLQISAKKFFRVVETGRKPTPGKKPSRAMIDNITEWLQALGKEESLAWAIATSINQKGTKLYRDGGRQDVFSNVLSDRAITNLEKSVLDIVAAAVLKQYIEDLEKLKLVKDVSISA